ncbi:hypothetical protein [Mycolicibacterium iranicum]|uniref:ESX-1 secretion-associated protein n=1 Tax=Mycolicibacterium iranicum TaxID=912594 RepID=A0ABT4HKL7_MYCIR|nr:hypothetical protein [Mycolicibacterium iranicum]MCZ0730745.1 hypothetical protein [Mycolicibacterium iranicum]
MSDINAWANDDGDRLIADLRIESDAVRAIGHRVLECTETVVGDDAAAAAFLRNLAAQIEAIANAAQTTVGHVAVYGESMRSVDAMGDRLIRGE